MFLRPVTLVPVESVLRILFVYLGQEAIARHFGHDGSAGDGKGPLVAMDQRDLPYWQARDSHRIDQHRVYTGSERANGLRHCPSCR